MRTQDEKDRIQAALVAVWVATKDGSMPIEKQRAYLAALSDLSVVQIELACAEAMKSCVFFPKPVELIEFVTGPKDLQAEAAWQLVLEAMEQHGAYKTVEFSDPRISRAIQSCGGWIAICDKTETWLKKDFIAAYSLQKENCHAVKCIGILDRDNKRYRPNLIGPMPSSPRIETRNKVSEIASGVVSGLGQRRIGSK